MQIKDLKQDKRNYRKHNQRNLDLIKKSVTEVGLGRSVVIDNENEIVCGNGLVSTLDKNTPIKVIETDGSELVVVKRTDLATNDDKRKQLAIMDNSTSESSEWDFEKLEADFDTEELEDWGLDICTDEMTSDAIDNVELNKELNDFRGLIYEPNGEKPQIDELYTEEGIEDFKKKIEKAKINEAEKEFLKIALTRFYKFNFKKIAEYYCQSNNEVKELFEDLILVIPDGEKLLRNELLKLDNITVELENE